MVDFQVPEEILEYKSAIFFPQDNSYIRAEFSFNIAYIDCLKPFVVLDYFPEDILISIMEGYCLTSEADMNLSSRINIISRVLGDFIGWEKLFKDFLGVISEQTGLNTITLKNTIKDVYVITLAADSKLLHAEYIAKIIRLFNKIEGTILNEMVSILDKISSPIEDPISKSFVEFEISTLRAKLKDKEFYPPGMACIKNEAKRRLAPKVASLYKRMS